MTPVGCCCPITRPPSTCSFVKRLVKYPAPCPLGRPAVCYRLFFACPLLFHALQVSSPVLWLVVDFLTCRMVGLIKDTLPFLYWNRGGIWDTLLPPSLSTSVSEQTAFPPAHPLENDEIRLSKEGESIFHKTFYWEIIAKVIQCSADVITIGSVVLETVLVLCVSSPGCHCA